MKKLWEERGFVFDSFVEESGIGRGYISELTRGLVVPTIHALQKMADALELTPADLLLGNTAREKLFDATRTLSKKQLEELLRQVIGMSEAAVR